MSGILEGRASSRPAGFTPEVTDTSSRDYVVNWESRATPSLYPRRSPMPEPKSDPIFPLPFAPIYPYDSDAPGVSGFQFGVLRNGGPRIHAGCDLRAPFGTPVMAIDDGEVHFPAWPFYGKGFPNIWVIAIWHPKLRDGQGLLVRYGEIEQIPAWFTRGAPVKRGKVLGKVSHQLTKTKEGVVDNSMLHVEFYSTSEKGDTTRQGNEDNYDNVTPMRFERRHDLLNPTSILRELQRNIVQVAKDAYER
jgi:murein DD-endopeptidase MepM/ murein hydrolase activator NlpD